MANRYNPPNFRENKEALVKSGELGTWHVMIECQNDPEGTMITIAPEGPYAYTVHKIQSLEEKMGRLDVVTTREGILEYYKIMHARNDVVDWHRISEIRGGWYGFQYGLGDIRLLPSGEMVRNVETLLLVPTFGMPGITGELAGFRYLDPRLPDPPEDGPKCGPEARAATFKRDDLLIEAFRREDVEAIGAAFADNCQVAICDYVTESGTLVSLHGPEEIRTYYKALFEKFHVRSVDVVQRLVEDWFLFHELLWTLESRTGDGRVVSCSTAEFFTLTADGKLWWNIGHGTAPVPV